MMIIRRLLFSPPEYFFVIRHEIPSYFRYTIRHVSRVVCHVARVVQSPHYISSVGVLVFLSYPILSPSLQSIGASPAAADASKPLVSPQSLKTVVRGFPILVPDNKFRA